jgi:DNA repair exonuclease SbcCD ATPase subunit
LDKYESQEAKLEENLEKLNKYLKKSNSAKIEINNYKNSKKIIEQSIKHIESNIVYLVEQLEKINNEMNPYSSMLDDSLIEKKNINSSLNKLTNVNQYYGIIKEIFSENGVKQLIIQKIIEVLNGSIHSYLRQMGADFLVYFDNKLVYNFCTPTGPCEYSSFSAGERRKLDLAILFAFRDILGCSSLKTNICIIDEILDSAIDTVTLNSVMSILKNKSKIDNQSIYVISHREGLAESDIFDHKIRIEKENGNSKVYQEF